MKKIDLKNLTPDGIDRFCAEELGQKPGQGLRVAAMLYRNRLESLDLMTGLNRPFRESLTDRCVISSLPIERTENSEDGAKKLLYLLEDGNTVEGVLIPGPDRLTLCVSTQVGCASGCGFCLTGSGGFVRNLAAAELVNQVFAAQTIARSPITNIVLMGAGEPLANYDAVRTFLDIATSRYGMGYSGKKVVLSTCGLAPMIEKMAEDGVDASLAVSLNAATDDIRDKIMPVNRKFPLERLMKAIRFYAGRTGRSVTIEYILIRGVNDAADDAKRLTELLGGLPCMVNLLLFNPFPGSAFERPDDGRASVFRDVLVSAKIVAVVRKSRGRDIFAACGQLRASGGTMPG